MNKPTSVLLDMALTDPAIRAFGVDLVCDGPTGATFTQAIGPQFADHRSLTTLASIAVLLDAAAGSAAFIGGAGESNYVVASISVAMAHQLPLTGSVVATSSVGQMQSDGQSCISTGQATAEGQTVAVFQCLSIQVDRTRIAAAELEARAPVPADARPLGDVAKPGVSAYTEHVSLTVLERSTEHSVEASWFPQRWALNSLGSVHGGVLIGLMSTVSELLVDSLAGGPNFLLGDIRVDMLKSPNLDTGELSIKAVTVRRGRRLAFIDCSITTDEGRLIAKSRSTAIFSLAD